MPIYVSSSPPQALTLFSVSVGSLRVGARGVFGRWGLWDQSSLLPRLLSSSLGMIKRRQPPGSSSGLCLCYHPSVSHRNLGCRTKCPSPFRGRSVEVEAWRARSGLWLGIGYSVWTIQNSSILSSLAECMALDRYDNEWMNRWVHEWTCWKQSAAALCHWPAHPADPGCSHLAEVTYWPCTYT